MDNRIFNVNGSGSEMLLKALELVFKQEGDNTTCKGWQESKEGGLILCWWADGIDDITRLPAPCSATQCLSFVEQWLVGDFAKTVELSKWCGDQDHDGHNSNGWQVYVDDWGHVGDQRYSICAIKPAYMWHGK